MRAAQAQVTQADVDSFTEGLPTSDFFGQNLLTDQAVSALEYIFGDVINVVAGLPPSEGLSLGTPDTPFAAMIGMMNTGLLFLGAVYLAWVTLTGVLYSADKGEIFGGKWSVVWMPLKTTLGVSAIFPAVYGYSWLQFFVFWVLLQGIGLGNAVMNKGFDMFKDNREFSQIAPVSPDLVRAGYNILRSSYCAEAINQVPVEAAMAVRIELDRSKAVQPELTEGQRRYTYDLGNTVPEQELTGFSLVWDSVKRGASTAFAYVRDNPNNRSTSTQPLPPRHDYRMKLHHAAASNRQDLIDSKTSGDVYQTAHYYWGLPTGDMEQLISDVETGEIKEAARKDYCGHLTYTRQVDYYIEPEMLTKLQVTVDKSRARARATSRVVQELDTEEMQRLISLRDQKGGLYGFGANIDQNIPAQEFAALHKWVTTVNGIGVGLAQLHNPYKKQGGGYSSEQGDGAPSPAQFRDAINRFTAATREFTETSSDLDEMYLNVYVGERDKTLESHYWNTFTNNLERDGFLSFGTYYVELSEARANLRERLTPTFTYEDSSPNVWDYFDMGMEGNNEITSQMRDLSDSQLLSLFRYFKGYQDFHHQMQLQTGVIDPGTVVPGTENYDKSLFGGRGDNAIEKRSGEDDTWVQREIDEVMESIYGSLTGFMAQHTGIAELQSRTGPPPLLRIREMGQGFMGLSGVMVGLGGAGSAITLLTSKVWSYAGGLLGEGISTASAAMMTLALWLAILGGFLAVYLPMVPFLVWVGAVIGYFLLAIESIIAAPLWAIAFMEPGTQDGPGGKNAQGWYLVMNLFLRPVLLVVAMIAVMLLADVVLRYLNTYMIPAFEMADAGGSTWTKLLSFIWQSIIYCVFLMTTMHGVYSLIHRIPDNIMEWLGVGVRGLGDTSDERDVRTMVMGAIQRARTPSAQQLSALGRRGKGAQTPEKEGGPTVRNE